MSFSRNPEGNVVPQKLEDSGIACEKCGSPMVVRNSRRGPFLACSGYPKCRNAMSFTRDEATGKITPKPRAAAMVEVNEKCEKCGAPMAIKGSRRGSFLACTAYPKCKSTKPLSDEIRQKLDEARAKIEGANPAAGDGAKPAVKPKTQLTDIACEKCGKPMAIRTSARGMFLGCSGYPKCRNAKPLPPDLAIKPAAAATETAPKMPAEATAGQLKKKRLAAQAKQDAGSRVAAEAAPKTAAKPKAQMTEMACENCGKPMVIRASARGTFLACSGYPKCKTTKPLPPDLAEKLGVSVAAVAAVTPAKAAPEMTDEKCEKCGSDMVVKKGRRGPFLACSAYPACRNARDLGAPAPAAIGDALLGDGTPRPAPVGGAYDASVQLPPCPKCGAPTSIRRSFRGAFCGCTKYPDCKGTAPVPAGALPKREPPKPAGVNCPQCDKPMVIRQGKRGPFAGCSAYPKCRGTMPMEDVVAAGGSPQA